MEKECNAGHLEGSCIQLGQINKLSETGDIDFYRRQRAGLPVQLYRKHKTTLRAGCVRRRSTEKKKTHVGKKRLQERRASVMLRRKQTEKCKKKKKILSLATSLLR